MPGPTAAQDRTKSEPPPQVIWDDASAQGNQAQGVRWDDEQPQGSGELHEGFWSSAGKMLAPLPEAMAGMISGKAMTPDPRMAASIANNVATAGGQYAKPRDPDTGAPIMIPSEMRNLHLAAAMASPVGGQGLEKMLEQTEVGNLSGAAGTGAGLAAPFAAGEVLPAARPYVGEGLARTGGVLSRNAGPIGKTVGYGGAGLTTIEELMHGRPLEAAATALLSPLAANRAVRLTSAVGEGLTGLGNKIGRTPRPLFGPEPMPEGYAQYQEPAPAPYRLRGNEIADATTILPRNTAPLPPSRQLSQGSLTNVIGSDLRGAPSYFDTGKTPKTNVPLRKMSGRGGNITEGLREQNIRSRAVDEMNAQTVEGQESIRAEMERPGGAFRGKESAPKPNDSDTEDLLARSAATAKQPFVLAKIAGKPIDEVLMKVDAEKLDAARPRDTYYVGSGGTGEGAIKARYDNFRKWMHDNPSTPIEAPRVTVDAKGSVDFTNGRHRFAVMRDMGMRQIQVSVPPDQVQAFQKAFGASRVSGPRLADRMSTQ